MESEANAIDEKNLDLFWKSFIYCTDENEKEKWLLLFLFECDRLRDVVNKWKDLSFRSSVASQLFRYLLQTVYALICKAKTTVALSHTENNVKNVNVVKNETVEILQAANGDSDSNSILEYCGDNDYRFEHASLIISQTAINTGDDREIMNKFINADCFSNIVLANTSDIEQIVALRRFLLNDVGGKILLVLKHIGVKGIACGRELVGLLINMYPSCPWDENLDVDFQMEIAESKARYDFERLFSMIKIYDNSFGGLRPNLSSLSLQQTEDMLSSPLSIEWLSSFKLNEMPSLVDFTETKVFKSFSARRFSCDFYTSVILDVLVDMITDEPVTTLDENSVTVQCLKFAMNAIKRTRHTYAGKIILRQLMIILNLCLNNCYKSHKSIGQYTNIYEMISVIIATLEKVIKDNGSQRIRFNIVDGLSIALFVILNNTFYEQDNENSNFKQLLHHFQELETPINRTITWLIETDRHEDLLRLLLKFMAEIENRQERKRLNRKTRKNRRHLSIRESHNDLKETARIQLYRTYLEQQMIHAINKCSGKNLLKTLRHFQRYPILKINCNMKTVRQLIDLIRADKFTPVCLKLLDSNIVPNIFENISITNEYGSGYEIIDLYEELSRKLRNRALVCLLKHIVKIKSILPDSVHKIILTRIILPMLKDQIYRTVNSQETVAERRTIIRSCLYAIVQFVNTKEAAVAFFSEENLKDLSELSFTTEYMRYVCNILCVGLEYGIDIEREFFEIIEDTTDVMLEFFNSVCPLELFKNYNETNRENKVLNLMRKRKLKLIDCFQLTAIYWRALHSMSREVQRISLPTIADMMHRKLKGNQNLAFSMAFNALDCVFRSANKLISAGENDFCILSGNDSLENSTLRVNCIWDKNTSKDLFFENLMELNDSNPSVLQTNYDLFYSDVLRFFVERSAQNKFEFLQQQIEVGSICSHRTNSKTIPLFTLMRNNDKVFQCKDTEGSSTRNHKYQHLHQYQYQYQYQYQFQHQHQHTHQRRNDGSKNLSSVVTYNCGEDQVTTSSLSLLLDTNQINTYKLKPDKNLDPSDGQDILLSSAGRLSKFLGFDVFGLLSPNENRESDKFEKHHRNINKQNSDLVNSVFSDEDLSWTESLECRNCLINLFEIFLSVYLLNTSGCNSDQASMLTSLAKLKQLLLTYSIDQWSSVENGTTIMSVLQTLLRTAEVYSINDIDYKISNQFKDDCNREGIGISNNESNATYEFLSPPQSFDTDDLELSGEDSTEENYLTAEEGYDADAEIPLCTDSESDISRVFKVSMAPKSKYRSHVVYGELCKIVVDLLIELSQKCIEESTFWIPLLSQLANRLSVIRESLGGCTFLLNGFSQVLECSDNKLLELQKSILELIVDLTSADSLAAFLKLFSSKNPPVDLLLPRLNNLATLNLQVQPSVAMSFLSSTENTISRSCDASVANYIKLIHDYHRQNQLKTAFTSSTFIVPLDYINFCPWTGEGSTVSMWIQLNRDAEYGQFSSKRNQVDNSFRNSTFMKKDALDISDASFYNQNHIVSVGTTKLLLSVYLDDEDFTKLILHITKPNANVQDVAQRQEYYRSTSDGVHGGDVVSPDILSAYCRKAKRSKSPLQKTVLISQEADRVITGTDIEDLCPLKATKSSLKSKLSNLNIFSMKSEQKAPSSIDVAFIEIKSVRLPNKKWFNFTISIKAEAKTISVTITIDGTDQYKTSIECDGVLGGEKNAIPVLTFGHYEMLSGVNETKRMFEYTLSNILMFKSAITEPNVLAGLVALGSDCTNLIHCQTGNIALNTGYLNQHKIPASVEFYPIKTLDYLRKNILCSYSVHQPNVVFGYNTKERTEFGEAMGLITFGNGFQIKCVPSIQTATVLCGGVSSLLFLFARVVELTASSQLQSMALNLLLRIVHSQTELYTEFQRMDGLNMIGAIVRTERCIKNVTLLQGVFEAACDVSVLTKRTSDNQIIVIQNTNACVIYPNLLISILTKYSDWQPIDDNTELLETLLSGILALVREKHPYQCLNMSRFADANLIPALLSFCKIFLVGSSQQIPISKRTASFIVELISIFAGAPPSSSLLDEIAKLLLLLHHPSDSFITHDRSKFYFLLSSHEAKTKKLSLTLPTVSLSHKPKERTKTNAHRAKKSARIIRSISLENSPLQKRTSTPVESLLDSIDRDTKKEDNSGEQTEDLVEFKKSKTKNSEKCLDAGEAAKLTKLILNLQLKHTLKTRKRIRRLSLKSKSYSAQVTPNETDDEDDVDGGTVSESGIESDTRCITNEYDIVGLEDVSTLSTECSQQTPTSGQTNPIRNLSGTISLQHDLFNLLRDFVQNFPDKDIQQVLEHYVTVEILLVMSNNFDVNVRCSILRLLKVVCERLSPAAFAHYARYNFWMHLGNQLSLHPINETFVEICGQWITGLYQTVGDFSQWTQLSAMSDNNKCAFNILMGCLTQTTHDIDLASTCFRFVEWLFKSDINCASYLIDQGLIPAICKALTKFCVKCEKDLNRAIEPIQLLMETIAVRALTFAGSITNLWDLLNSLTFLERHRKGMPQIVARRIQSCILTKLLEICSAATRSQHSSINLRLRVLKPADSGYSLSTGEMRTRFDLVLDRSLQFITTCECSHVPETMELRLIEQLISLVFAGHYRIGAILPWSLCPSRPINLKMFAVKSFVHNTSKSNLNGIGCDLKLVNILTESFLFTDREILNDENLDILNKFSCSLGGTANISWKLSHALEKICIARENCIKEQKPAIDRTVYKFESFAQNCIESAMQTTRTVVETQNVERRAMINQMRMEDENTLYDNWQLLIERMTHEGAPWYNAKVFPSSWEIDNTEGPARLRNRLKRCTLHIKPKFLMTRSQERNDMDFYQPLLSFLTESFERNSKFVVSDQILITVSAKYMPVDEEVDGEMLITENQFVFVANDASKHITCSGDNLLEVWPRRYQHQEVGLEFFLEFGNTLFFIFNSEKDRDTIKRYFTDTSVHCLDNAKINHLTQQWRDGQSTNWEYLIALNQYSGRTFHDLMQYPVFPWVLADYRSAQLDLLNESSFRKFGKPIAIQYKENELHFINNYNYLLQVYRDTDCVSGKPYHYGSHYSNSGTVLHFLVRMLPYTKLFLQYQDNNFDIPDRTFHSLYTTWRLASRDSTTDVKEIIPEFFSLPEMFENNEGFNFGWRQSGERVHHVNLPPWSGESARLFVLIHRQALESEFVRSHLNEWVDLVFGYKQTGQAAIDTLNVFHPATYIGFSATNIEDPVEKMACETMIRTYGQMPKQLFKGPHPTPNINPATPTDVPPIIKTVKGLRWGVYTGSPQLSDPKISNVYQHYHSSFGRLIALENTNVVYGVPSKCNIMQGPDSDTMNLINWGDIDGVVKISPLSESTSVPKPLTSIYRIDPISCCGTDPYSTKLWFGHQSGRITVYQCKNSSPSKYTKSWLIQNTGYPKFSYNSAIRKLSSKSVMKSNEVDIGIGSNEPNAMNWRGPFILIRHTDEVLSIVISAAFKIAISVSTDGTAVIWDTNKLQYIRTIPKPTSISNSPAYLAAVSPTLGDIVSVHSTEHGAEDSQTTDMREGDTFEVTESNIDDFVKISINLSGKSLLRLHTINAKYVNHVMLQERLLSVVYSNIKEGTGVNVIATGFENGIIRLWSSWNLDLVREMYTGHFDVLCLKYSTYQHLVALTSDDLIQVWESPGLNGPLPKFPQLVFNKRSSV